jgi:hypothetical protein
VISTATVKPIHQLAASAVSGNQAIGSNRLAAARSCFTGPPKNALVYGHSGMAHRHFTADSTTTLIAFVSPTRVILPKSHDLGGESAYYAMRATRGAGCTA